MKTAREVIANKLGEIGKIVYFTDAADSILSALKESGYAVVPVEPTEAMHKVSLGNDVLGEKFWFDNRYPDAFTDFWKAMVASSQDQGRG